MEYSMWTNINNTISAYLWDIRMFSRDVLNKFYSKNATKSLHVIYHEETGLDFVIEVDHYRLKYCGLIDGYLIDGINDTKEFLNKLSENQATNVHCFLNSRLTGGLTTRKDFSERPKRILSDEKIEKLITSIETDNYHQDSTGGPKVIYFLRVKMLR